MNNLCSIWSAVWLILGCSRVVWAQDFKAQADSLAAAQPERAIILYEKAIFTRMLPADSAAACLLGKAQCYKRLGQHAEAAATLERLQNRTPEANYAYLLALYLSGQDAILQSAWAYLPEPERNDLLFLCVLSLHRSRNWPTARLALQLYDSLYAAQLPVDVLYAPLGKLRSEKKARWLSLLPGAGQVYAGQYGKAAVSVLLQGVSVWYGVGSWQQGYRFSALATGGGLWQTFYTGGGRLAVKSVKAYNEVLIMQVQQQVQTAILLAEKRRLYEDK